MAQRKRTTTCEDAPENLTMTIYKGIGPATTALRNGSTLTLLEGESLHMVCTVDSNPPARLSWAHENLILSPIQSSTPGLLELPGMHLRYEGKFTCSAQNILGSQHMSLSLFLKRKSGLMVKVVLVAVVEAAVKVLLLGLCLILRVRSRKKRTARAECTGTIQTRSSVSFSDATITHFLHCLNNPEPSP